MPITGKVFEIALPILHSEGEYIFLHLITSIIFYLSIAYSSPDSDYYLFSIYSFVIVLVANLLASYNGTVIALTVLGFWSIVWVKLVYGDRDKAKSLLLFLLGLPVWCESLIIWINFLINPTLNHLWSQQYDFVIFILGNIICTTLIIHLSIILILDRATKTLKNTN